MILSSTTEEGNRYSILRSWMYWIPYLLMGVKLLLQHKFRLELQIGHKGALYSCVAVRDES